jgi:hypothetical protein
MTEEFVRLNFPDEIIDLFGGIENMSTFPILEWDTEWNDLRDMKRYCPTEPRWIKKDKIIAPFMMGIAFDHNNLARPFVLIRTTIANPDFDDEFQIFLLYRYETSWHHSCWTSHRSDDCRSEFEVECDEYFNDFDPRYDDATSIFEDEQVKKAKESGDLKGIKKRGSPKYEHEYDPRTCLTHPDDEYEMNDYSWNSDCHYCLLKDGRFRDKKLAEMINDLVTKKCINVKGNDLFSDVLVEYKVI